MAMPSYNIDNPSGPGLLYVNSKITNNEMSPELFTKWYEDEHIPDIFETKGILSAFRYYTTSPGQVDRPYLALYPVKDVSFLQSEKFYSIPVHSKLLPGDGLVFNLADFDTRYYSHISTKDRSSGATPQYVVTVSLDIPDGDSKASSFIESGKLPLADKAERVSLYKTFFARQNRLPSDEKKIAGPTPWVVILEFKEKSDLSKIQSALPDALVAEYKLLQDFGDKNRYFE